MVVMQLPQWLARFNRYVTNRVQRLWAGYVPAMGILEHVGRKSCEAAPHVTGFWKPIFARLPFDEAVLLRRT